jgi:hypothetical protein
MTIMSNKENKSIIETLFHEFIISSAKDDKDIEYCLLQSSVEPIIRFKFGSWLNKKIPERITLNLMEANRLDLVVGIDDKVYFIEFGHMLNLLHHGAYYNNIKVNNDKQKLELKVKKLIDKINKINKNYFQDKEKVFLVCSLFSDLKVSDKGDHFETSINLGRLNSGTLFKYGNLFSHKNKKSKEYFNNYTLFVNEKYMDTEIKYATGYTEVSIIPEKLSFHFKFDLFQLNP